MKGKTLTRNLKSLRHYPGNRKRASQNRRIMTFVESLMAQMEVIETEAGRRIAIYAF